MEFRISYSCLMDKVAKKLLIKFWRLSERWEKTHSCNDANKLWWSNEKMETPLWVTWPLNDGVNCELYILNIKCVLITAQKMKFSITDFFSKYDQIRRQLRIWSHLLKKSVNGRLHFLCSGWFMKYGSLKWNSSLKETALMLQIFISIVHSCQKKG